MKITTKKGDKGKTDLYRKRVSKTHPLIDLIGEVDNLVAIIGVIRSKSNKAVAKDLEYIQRDLMSVNSYLAGYTDYKINLKIIELKSEQYSSKINLTEFIVPGEDEYSSFINLARTETRKVERLFLKAKVREERLEKYLNRLSDYFFALMVYKLTHKE